MPTARPAVLAVLSLLFATPAWGGPEPLAAGPWPRTWTEGALTLSLFRPEVQAWDGNRLTLRSAAQVRKGERQTYGLVHLEARTELDLPRGVVRLVEVQVTRTEFPAVPDKEDHWRGLFQRHVAAQWEVALATLEADAAVADAERARAAVPPRNDPPLFVFRTAPALLVVIDGAPAWRPVEGTGLERVVNTRPLLVRDPATGQVWLRLLDGWMTAAALDQRFDVAGPGQPPALEAARAWAATQPQVDLLDGQPPPDAPPPAAGQAPPTLAGGAPEIVVSSVPAELIVTEGEPRLEAVAGTTLRAWKNTGADVLVDAGGAPWVLVAGRWFTAPTTAGPWRWVEPGALPAEFRAIPPGSARESVLSSVPGTAQAREAAIANQVPQTAAVRRSEATFTPSYDGAPALAPIEGTALHYVLNASTPVIRFAPDRWYAVQDGVWFTAPTPRGPWTVATSVPAAIYAIPASSPVHAVTYVRVYDATPEVVYVGYTPGYLGTYVGPGGLVYYGTGYAYPGWIGTTWYGAPYTYGYGIRMGWSSWGGWGLSVGWGWCPPGYGWGYGIPPYWGPPGYYRPAYVPGPAWRGPGRPPPPPPPRTYRGGAYGSWGRAAAPAVLPAPRPPPPPAQRPPPPGAPPAARPAAPGSPAVRPATPGTPAARPGAAATPSARPPPQAPTGARHAAPPPASRPSAPAAPAPRPAAAAPAPQRTAPASQPAERPAPPPRPAPSGGGAPHHQAR